MRILILGSGLLGQEFTYTPALVVRKMFRTYIHQTSWSKSDLDITNAQQVRKNITALSPHIIINCAAYTKVDAIQNDKQTAYAVNGVAVQTLARVANELNALLVHYSTDYVFDGAQHQGYRENDPPAQTPLNEYGVSKLQGEQHILGIARKFYIIRTSWLFGQYGNNFIHTVLKKVYANQPMNIVNNEYGRPTYAVDLVQATLSLIAQKRPFGIYHATNSGKRSSWYEYAQFIARSAPQYGTPSQFFPVTSQQYNAPAPRPANSVLLNTKLPHLRPWQSAVKQYMQSFDRSRLF